MHKFIDGNCYQRQVPDHGIDAAKQSGDNLGSCAFTGYDDKVQTIKVDTDALVWSKDKLMNLDASKDATPHLKVHKIIGGHCVDAKIPADRTHLSVEAGWTIGNCMNQGYDHFDKKIPVDFTTTEYKLGKGLMNLASETTMHRIVAGNCDEFQVALPYVAKTIQSGAEIGTCESSGYSNKVKSFPYHGTTDGHAYTVETTEYSKLMNLASETTMHRIVAGNCDEF
tara:strand:- start:251 stop:925 length:675 start_codon:yes stop_codon:yes gene_type:complete